MELLRRHGDAAPMGATEGDKRMAPTRPAAGRVDHGPIGVPSGPHDFAVRDNFAHKIPVYAPELDVIEIYLEHVLRDVLASCGADCGQLPKLWATRIEKPRSENATTVPFHPIAAPRLELDAEHAEQGVRDQIGTLRIVPDATGVDHERLSVRRPHKTRVSGEDRLGDRFRIATTGAALSEQARTWPAADARDAEGDRKDR